MNLEQGQGQLTNLGQRWRRRRRMTRILWAWAALVPGLLLVATSGALPLDFRGILGLVATAALVTLGVAARTPKLAPAVVAKHLDRELPELQNSTELLLGGERVHLLEQLQQRRTLDTLASLDLRRQVPVQGLVRALQALALSALASSLLFFAAPALIAGATREGPVLAPSNPNADVAEVGVLRQLEISVEPPAYTRQPRRTSSQHLSFDLNLEVQEGSWITWTIKTNSTVDQAQLVFDDRAVDLHGVPQEEPTAGLSTTGLSTTGLSTTEFSSRIHLDRPHLYHLRLAAAGAEVFRSPLARLEVLADSPPTVEIVRPEPFTEVDGQRPGRLAIDARVRDDHGLNRASLVVTLVAGSGEMVEFREHRIQLTAKPMDGDELSWRLGRGLNLEALGMGPGTELYFHLEARDNRQPQNNVGRSATHIVRATGSRGLSVDLGDGIPMVTLPDYFRSQRQIILDTEQLLKDREQITKKEFQQRCQELGFDQAALRLRYGALLGLEREGEVGAANPEDDHDPDHQGENHQFESKAMAETIAEVPESFFHAHDSSDVSSFFTSEVKTLLRSALREMWEAELHLRTFEPSDALPYENRALELIKRAQQAERVYVQRIGFDTPVVRPEEKRLTGDLDEIQSQRHRFTGSRPLAEPEARRALGFVRQWREDRSSLAPDFRSLLTPAAQVLARRAVREMSLDLEALEQLRRWSETGLITDDDLASVEQALWRLLPEPLPHPSRQDRAPGPLFELYLEQLKGNP